MSVWRNIELTSTILAIISCNMKGCVKIKWLCRSTQRYKISAAKWTLCSIDNSIDKRMKCLSILLFFLLFPLFLHSISFPFPILLIYYSLHPNLSCFFFVVPSLVWGCGAVFWSCVLQVWGSARRKPYWHSCRWQWWRCSWNVIFPIGGTIVELPDSQHKVSRVKTLPRLGEWRWFHWLHALIEGVVSWDPRRLVTMALVVTSWMFGQ
jgi:hypothetical protein